MSAFLDRYVWWHRLRGHEVASAGAFDIFGNTSIGCNTCGCRWRFFIMGDSVYYPASVDQ